MDDLILPFYAVELRKLLTRITYEPARLSDLPRFEPTASETACREWVEQREREAYRLAPWLKDELEAAESYY